MTGMIRTRQKCPRCGGKFQRGAIINHAFIPGIPGLACPTCFTQPTSVIIQVYWRGKKEHIATDKRGNRFTSCAAALQVLDAIRVEIRQKVFDPTEYQQAKSHLFSTYFQRFLRQYRDRKATLDKLTGMYRNHFGPVFGHLDLRDIRKIDLQDFMDSRTCSDRYKADMLVWLRSVFRAALDDEILDKLPRLPKPPTWQKPAIKWLSVSEQIEIVQQIPAQHRPIFAFMMSTGLRVSEACALKHDCIDYQHERFYIRRTFSRRRLVEHTKQRREVVKYLSPDLADLIRQQAVDISGFVFRNPDGKLGHYTEDFLNSTWKKACRKVGKPEIPLKNGTRHSYGSQLAASGHSPDMIAWAMGHSNTNMTRNYVGSVVELQKAMGGKTVVSANFKKLTD